MSMTCVRMTIPRSVYTATQGTTVASHMCNVFQIGSLDPSRLNADAPNSNPMQKIICPPNHGPARKMRHLLDPAHVAQVYPHS
jgi:hypothetical protein